MPPLGGEEQGSRMMLQDEGGYPHEISGGVAVLALVLGSFFAAAIVRAILVVL